MKGSKIDSWEAKGCRLEFNESWSRNGEVKAIKGNKNI